MAEAPQAVILAAGEGTRMRSAHPKVLHPLAGRPMIEYALDAVAFLGSPPTVVVGPSHEAVREHLGERAVCVPQASPRGTGDALRSVPQDKRSSGTVLVLYGDTPLLTEATVKAVFDCRERLGSACVVVSAQPEDFAAYGRLVRGSDGRVARVVEALDLTAGDGQPDEINVGVYAFLGSALWPALDQLQANNAKGELYLTDLVQALGGADSVTVADLAEGLGVNDRVQLAAAEGILRGRIQRDLMLSGVTIEDPSTTYIEASVQIGRDSVIRPMTTLRGATNLGANCTVGPGAQLTDVRAGERLWVGTSVLEGCEIDDDVTIGHFNRIRPGTKLARGVSLGTHAELKNSTVGANSRVGHFSCVLDSDLGTDVNVGAGTVTCNFDGSAKHRTIVGDRVFLGTNSTLVAPLRIDDDAYVAAGSIVNGDVPAGALAVGRAKQRNVEGWRERRIKAVGS